MIVYLHEQYTHETNYENYITNMLWNILGIKLGKGANMPKQYHEITQNNQGQEKIQKVTKNSVKEMFLNKQKI